MATLISKARQDEITKWSKSWWMQLMVEKFNKSNIDINNEYKNNYFHLMTKMNELGQQHQLSGITTLGTLTEALYLANNKKD